MSMKVKGLLKGLRYISHIFEEEEEEPELQIGLPTDVKHVAHIGWDGPTTNAPSWINQFKGEGASTPTSPNDDQQNASKARDPRHSVQGKRSSNVSESSLDSPSRRRSGKSRSSRRQTSSVSQGVDSPSRLSEKSEQNRTKFPPGVDSPAHDSASSSATKATRRKKSKASSTKTTSKSKSTSQPLDNLSHSASQTTVQDGSAPSFQSSEIL